MCSHPPSGYLKVYSPVPGGGSASSARNFGKVRRAAAIAAFILASLVRTSTIGIASCSCGGSARAGAESAGGRESQRKRGETERADHGHETSGSAMKDNRRTAEIDPNRKHFP